MFLDNSDPQARHNWWSLFTADPDSAVFDPRPSARRRIDPAVAFVLDGDCSSSGYDPFPCSEWISTDDFGSDPAHHNREDNVWWDGSDEMACMVDPWIGRNFVVTPPGMIIAEKVLVYGGRLERHSFTPRLRARLRVGLPTRTRSQF